MEWVSLTEKVRTNLEAAAQSAHGRLVERIHGQEPFRQMLVCLRAGSEISDHENPGQASLLVLQGHVRVVAGDDAWEGTEGDFLVIPERRHNLVGVTNAAVLLSFVRAGR